jgi:hypothetical protein
MVRRGDAPAAAALWKGKETVLERERKREGCLRVGWRMKNLQLEI